MIKMKLAIGIGDRYTSLYTDSKEIRDIIKEECSFEKKDWQFAREKWIKKARAAGDDWQLERALSWDGTISLLQGSSFPTGLLSKVMLRLAVAGVGVEVNDVRIRPRRLGPPLEMSPKFEQREYQREAFTASQNADVRGIIKSPTGSGKTIMGAMLIAHLHMPTLILVDKVVLIKQWMDALNDMIKMPSGYVGRVQGRNIDPSIITVASVQSLMSWKRKKKDEWKMILGLHPQGWGMIIEDECHHLGADGRYGVNMAIPAYYRIGFSATPLDRGDANLRVVAATGPVIFELPAEDLIEQGMLAKPIIQFIPVGGMYFGQHEKYIDVYRSAIVRNDNRNQAIVQIIKHQAMKRRKVLVFVDFIEHGETLQGMLVPETVIQVDDHPWMESHFVHGEDPDREDKFDWFKEPEGSLNVLVATEGLIGEGFDYKGIDVVVVADGGKSSIQTIQKIGRGMRVTKDKKEVRIFDFADRCKYLSEHAEERLKIWRNVGYDVEVPEYMDK